MPHQLSRRDKRAITITLVAIVGLLLFLLHDYGTQVADDLAVEAKHLETMVTAGAGEKAQARLLTAVPAFTLPADLGKQRLLFESEVNRQLKQHGINPKSLKFIGPGKAQAGLKVKLLRLECEAKCKFAQALDFLAAVQENPYLVGVEAFSLTCDEKKREQVDLKVRVSTFYQD